MRIKQIVEKERIVKGINIRGKTKNLINYKDLKKFEIDISDNIGRHPTECAVKNFYIGVPYKNKGMTVYTDGSKINNGTGSAVCILDSEWIVYQGSYKLSDNCTIMQAELFAIKKGIETMIDNFDVVIDSRMALNVIMQKWCMFKIADEIKDKLSEAQKLINIEFYWVKTHSNIRGNDIADKLAKRAAILNQNIVYDRILISLINNKIKNRVLEEWQNE